MDYRYNENWRKLRGQGCEQLARPFWIPKERRDYRNSNVWVFPKSSCSHQAERECPQLCLSKEALPEQVDTGNEVQLCTGRKGAKLWMLWVLHSAIGQRRCNDYEQTNNRKPKIRIGARSSWGPTDSRAICKRRAREVKARPFLGTRR